MEKEKSYYPDVIYVSESSVADELTARVISRLQGVEVRHIAEDKDPISELGLEGGKDLPLGERFSRGKRVLQLSRYKGEWLRACPGTSQHVCCNLWVVNPGEGCPLDCTYCYLQSYLKRNPSLKIYTNTAELLEAVRRKASEHPDRLFRVGTGELIDSLVWDGLTDSTLEFVPFFAGIDNAILELKTKTAEVGNLLSLKNEHQGKTVVSWSVNAEEVTRKDEAFTASLDERLDAASRLRDAGYRLGFHFDPLIHFDGWKEGYQKTVKKLFEAVSPSDIAWISVSSLRYQREMGEVMKERFPNSSIPYGEQFLAKDNKLRYFQPLRLEMTSFVWNELKKFSSKLPVYMCMESSTAWRNINGGAPVAGAELVEVFSKKGRLPVVNDKEVSQIGEVC